MIKFIIQNREWIFSGIGVTVIIGIFVLVKNIFYKSKEEKNKVGIHLHPLNEVTRVDEYELIPIQKVSLLSFSEIEEQIKKVPPLQREDVKKISLV